MPAVSPLPWSGGGTDLELLLHASSMVNPRMLPGRRILPVSAFLCDSQPSIGHQSRVLAAARLIGW